MSLPIRYVWKVLMFGVLCTSAWLSFSSSFSFLISLFRISPSHIHHRLTFFILLFLPLSPPPCSSQSLFLHSRDTAFKRTTYSLLLSILHIMIFVFFTLSKSFLFFVSPLHWPLYYTTKTSPCASLSIPKGKHWRLSMLEWTKVCHMQSSDSWWEKKSRMTM